MSNELTVSDKLTKKLIELWNDREFVIGTLSFAATEEDRQDLLEFIENHHTVTVETVSIFAAYLHQQREKQNKEK